MKIDESRMKVWKNDKGEFHRINGPAVIWPNGSQAWYIEGKYHRLTGPAVIGSNGSKSWWINDKHISNEVNEWIKGNNYTYPFDEETQVEFKLRFA